MPISKKLQNRLKNQSGSYFVVSALILFVLFGFAALGIEIGRWYTIQGEISKSIDGAAFAGAKNVSNPKFSDANGNPDEALLAAFVEEVAAANFPPGLLGTDTPNFVVMQDGTGRVQVDGDVNSINNLTTVFTDGTPKTNLKAVGAAKIRKAEIGLVLDVSKSMEDDIDQLKSAAEGFVNNFQAFQDDHKFALITFATGAQTIVELQHQFVFNMTDEIGKLNANGGTNTEDALGQAFALDWEPDQKSEPPNERTRQIVIIFSDGNPGAFRADFKYNGNDMEAIGVLGSAGPDQPPTIITGYLGDPDFQADYFVSNWGVKHGDGNPLSSSACGSSGMRTTKWDIFQDSTYGIQAYGSPMSGYSDEDCNVRKDPDWNEYGQWLVRQMAIDHATELKNMGVEIFSIGLGNIDQGFLTTLATDAEHAYFTTDSGELDSIFQDIANKLKLVLVK